MTLLPPAHVLFTHGFIDIGTLLSLRACCKEFRDDLEPFYMKETQRLCRRQEGNSVTMYRTALFVQTLNIANDEAILSKIYDLFACNHSWTKIAKTLCTAKYGDMYIDLHPVTLIAFMNSSDKLTIERVMLNAWKQNRLFLSQDLMLSSQVDIAYLLKDLFNLSQCGGPAWLWLIVGIEKIVAHDMGKSLLSTYKHCLESCETRLLIATRDMFLQRNLEIKNTANMLLSVLRMIE